MKNFAITGAAGYVAPRHLKAIKKTGNNLIAAFDPHDSVGVLDQYFSETQYFYDFERFDRHLEKLKRSNPSEMIDYLSICSPNHLHDAHIRLALRLGADAICEKPIVLNPWNLDLLQKLEKETGRRVYTILQLRVHPSILKLKEQIESSKSKKKYDVLLTYITSRGPWYQFSWKGDAHKSGGIGTNIGIHFFDLLGWLFGGLLSSQVYLSSPNKMSGFLELKNANVRWFLSIDKNDLPPEATANNKRTYRSIKINNEEMEFTEGFTELHTRVYEKILSGNGDGIDIARPSVEIAYKIRNANLTGKMEAPHPFLIKGVE